MRPTLKKSLPTNLFSCLPTIPKKRIKARKENKQKEEKERKKKKKKKKKKKLHDWVANFLKAAELPWNKMTFTQGNLIFIYLF